MNNPLFMELTENFPASDVFRTSVRLFPLQSQAHPMRNLSPALVVMPLYNFSNEQNLTASELPSSCANEFNIWADCGQAILTTLIIARKLSIHRTAVEDGESTYMGLAILWEVIPRINKKLRNYQRLYYYAHILEHLTESGGQHVTSSPTPAPLPPRSAPPPPGPDHAPGACPIASSRHGRAPWRDRGFSARAYALLCLWM